MSGLASFRVLCATTHGNGDRRIHEISTIRAMAHLGIGAAVIEIVAECRRFVDFVSWSFISGKRLLFSLEGGFPQFSYFFIPTVALAIEKPPKPA